MSVAASRFARAAGRPAARVTLLVLLALSLLAAPAAAQAPRRERQFVYGINAYTGTKYATHFVPASVDTIYLLANEQNVLDPKMTEVYYWPPTSEYRPDFSSLNELVEGRLEIVQGGQVVSTVELTDYVVQFDQAREMGSGRLFLGGDARARWDAFQAERQGYLDRMRAYSDAYEAFVQSLADLRKRAEAGETVTAPPVPNQPAPFTLYSTEITRGFPIMLPLGEYTIRARDASGQVQPGSQKRLVMFGPRRQGVGYEVVPEEKWTYPINADDPGTAIYTLPSGVIYLQPFRSLEFNALSYARLENPQDVEATENRWTWVHVAPLPDTKLIVAGPGGETTLGLAELSVQQIAGPALGYRVVPFERRPDDPPPGTLGERNPDLVAFRVASPDGRATLSLRAVDANGVEQPGGRRDVVVIAPVSDWQIALPVVLPLVVGLTVLLWRREQVQRVGSLSPEERQLVA